MTLTNQVPLTVLDSLPGILFWKSCDFKYQGANKRFLKVTGLNSVEQLIGKKDSELPWPEHCKEYFSSGDDEIISGGKPKFDIQGSILSQEKAIITIITDKFPIHNENGEIIGILGISTDMFDQQYTSRTYLENLIEIIPYYIFWKNTDLVYLGCNKKFASLVGKKNTKEVIGKTDFDLNWGVGEAELFQLGDRRSMSGNPTINMEEELVRPDGSKIIMLVNKIPLLDQNGACIGLLGTSADITEIKNTQDKLKEAEERLSGLRALSASIAHELRTPLSAIRFGLSGTKDYLPVLVDAYKKAKTHQLDIEPIQSGHLEHIIGMFDNIESEVRYSETIINMTLMNVKQGGVPTGSFKVYSISDCISEALSRYPLKEGEPELITRSDGRDFKFKGDKTLMVHILFNLLKNALYFIEATKKGTIKIWCDTSEESNILYFKDTAKGIPSDVLPNVFERFYTTTYHGTGLGLAYCKTVMTAFEGDIKCTSEYGEFTQFEMIFPKVKDDNTNSGY